MGGGGCGAGEVQVVWLPPTEIRKKVRKALLDSNPGLDLPLTDELGK